MYQTRVLRFFLLLILLTSALALDPLVRPVQAGGVVTNCTSFSGPGSLEEALVGGGTITFACSGTIRLPQATQITIASDTTIDGTGQNITLRGNANRIFYVNLNVNFTLRFLTLTEGSSSAGSAIQSRGITSIYDSVITGNRVNASGRGAGVYNNGGTMYITRSVISDNVITQSGKGAGVYNLDGSLTISNSTISGNRVDGGTGTGGMGGGVYLDGDGPIQIRTTTISNNSVNLNASAATEGYGAGLYSALENTNQTLTLTNVTFSGNTVNGSGSSFAGGGIYALNGTLHLVNTTLAENSAGVGGGIARGGGSLRPKSTLIANNQAASNPDCSGALTSRGYNLIRNSTGCTGLSSTDRVNVDPLLGPLANNGGPTLTHALTTGSPAIDGVAAGSCTDQNGSAAITTDQRGSSRPNDGNADGAALCDIGAFEAPTVTPGIFSIDDVAVTEGDSGTTTTASFTVTRTGNTAITSTVQVATADGTATAGSDYVAVPLTTLTFDPGVTTQPVVVTVNGDDAVEIDETFLVNLSNQTYATLADAQGMGTILNDDTAGVLVDPTAVSVTEGGATDSYTVALAAPPTSGTVAIAVSFDPALVTINGSSVSPVTLNLSDTTPMTVTVEAVDNAAADGTRTGTLTHSVVSGPAEYTGVSVSGVAVTVTDNDSAGVSVNPTALTVAEGGPAGQYLVGLNTPPSSGTVEIAVGFDPALVTVNGSGTSPLTLSLSDTTPVMVTVAAVDNSVVDGTRTGTLSHSIASGPAEYLGLAVDPVALTVNDNDKPSNGGNTGLVIVEPQRISVKEKTRVGVFTIRLAAAPVAAVTVPLSVSDPAMCSAPAEVVIPAGDWSAGAQVAVNAVDNDAADGERACVVQTGLTRSSDTRFNGLDPANVFVTVEDNEYAPTAEDHARAQAPLCSLYGGGTNAIVRADVQPGAIWGGSVFCRVLAQNGAIMTDAGQIGDAGVLARGVIQAVDVFALRHDGSPVANLGNGVKVCLQGSGTLFYLDATQQPRHAAELPVSLEGGYSCAVVPNAGTVVLVGGAPGVVQPAGVSAGAPGGVSTPLTDCMVTTKNILNLRAEPGTSGAVIVHVPYDVRLTAMQRQGEWFMVDYLGTVGWLNAGYVNTEGGCAS